MIPGSRQVAVGLLIATVAFSAFAPIALGFDEIKTESKGMSVVSTAETYNTYKKTLEVPATGRDQAVLSLHDVQVGTGTDIAIAAPVAKESQLISIGISQESKTAPESKVKYGSGKAVSLFDTADSMLDDKVALDVEHTIEVQPFGIKSSAVIIDSAAPVQNQASSKNYNSNVRTSAGARLEVSAEELNEVLFGRFSGMGEELLELQDKYGVNIAFAVGVAQCETTCGQHGFGREEYNNPYNIRTSSGPYMKYESFYAGTEAFFKLISNCYLNPEHSYYTDGSVVGIGRIYAEDPEWANSVMSHMSNFIYRLKEAK